MRLSHKRRQEIYDAVHEEIIRLRIELQKRGVSDGIDFLIAQAGQKAASNAIKAAEGETPR